jgi:hypothetical protein
MLAASIIGAIAHMMEAASTYETLVNCYQTNILEHSQLHTLRRENLKSHQVNESSVSKKFPD